VNYKKVMQVYNLGPNGAIVTSLNLFATKFDEVWFYFNTRMSWFDFNLLNFFRCLA
jgi:hypothetical protein